jgi:2-polyprenyl-3-methyl-5-hydroxy-6-metoxy-1,4-benzoquinol methylase
MNLALKLKFYYDHVLSTVYAEGDSPYHKAITNDIIDRVILPMEVPKDAYILDLGCGVGYFMDRMKEEGYTNITGLTLSVEDIDQCSKKGHRVIRADMNFLSDKDESVDMLFCRHSLEHSPFPFFTLLEYNRVLKPGGKLYIEVPQPNCEKAHEDNRNHYSIMGQTMWLSLLQRSGFDVSWSTYEIPVKFGDADPVEEKYYIFNCTRRRPVDVK